MSETDKLALPDAPITGGGTVPTKHEHNYLLMAVRQAHAAKLCPAGETPEQTYLKLQRARELDVPINTALAQLYVVNGRVATMGRLKLALVRKSEKYGYRFEPVADAAQECKFTIWPRGHADEAYTAHWTIAKAKERGLAGKGAWAKYPDYMLRWRAVSEAVDLVAPDACDLPLVEELVADFNLQQNGGATILQETDDVLPVSRVVDMRELPAVNDSGYVLNPKAHEHAVKLMRQLDYPAQEIEAALAALTCDDDAKALAAKLKSEREQMTDFDAQAEAVTDETGNTELLFGDGDE